MSPFLFGCKFMLVNLLIYSLYLFLSERFKNSIHLDRGVFREKLIKFHIL
jgi:hypothetical protein